MIILKLTTTVSSEFVVHSLREWGRGVQGMVCWQWVRHNVWCGQTRWWNGL